MTREEAIDGLKVVRTIHNGNYAQQIDEAIKLLEQENILDKIRAEIEALEYLNIEDGSNGYDKYTEQYEVLKIIDKYRTESEDKELEK